jgi:outer membrane beta-barrel protein
MFNGGLNTQYTDQLMQNYSLDFSRAPKQKFAAFGNYEYKAYYGKVSFTKQGTMNLSTYPLIGLGLLGYDSKTYPGLDFGIGQKFYFSKNFGLRIDYKFQYAQGPSPFLIGRMKTTDPVPQAGEFSDKWTINNLIDVGLTFLF